MTVKLARVVHTPIVAAALVALSVTGCAGPAASTITPAETPKPGFVTKADYGPDWPFSAASGTLACYPSGNNDGRLLVTFKSGDGIEYALNGQARDFGFPELDATTMPAWPNASSLGPLIEQGLALCP